MSAARTNIWPCMVIALATRAACLCAQTPQPVPEPPALKALRQGFLDQLATDSRQLTEQFNKALSKVEDELAQTGEYEEAVALSLRRKEIDAMLARASAPAPSPGIPMPAAAARTSSLSMIDDDAITGWRTTGSYAEWTLQKLTPGRYAIQLSYVFTDAPTGSVTSPVSPSRTAAIEVAKFKWMEPSLLASSANTRLLELQRSKDAETYATSITEPITVTRGTLTLRLEAVQGYAGCLVRIKDVRLVPVEEKPSAAPSPASTSAPSASSSVGGETDVPALRQNFFRKLAAARNPLIADYQARLKEMAARPSLAHDRDIRDEIDAEIARATASSTSLAGPAGGRRGGDQGSSALDGWEDLAGARWVIDPGNTTERFKVEHEGRQFWVRLAWVRCPPASAADKDALHTATRHFKISDDDALAIGGVALEFARGYLEDRPLRLFVRTKKGPKDEPVPALVFLDDLGLFQTVLIDRGFAGYVPPEGNDRKQTRESAMMRMLQEHEQHAMKRTPPAGAWAFRTEKSK